MQILRDLWGGLVDRINSEPVAILTVVQMAIALLVSFGLGLTGEQTGAIVAFTAAILGAISRTQVTPTSTPTLSAGTTLTVTGAGPNRVTTV